MHKNYDARKAKSYRSYTIADLCRLYSEEGLHPQTVRGWVKHHHLPAMMHNGKLFIYGAVWKKYLYDRNNKRKRKLEFRQLKCVKCKAITEPLDDTIHRLGISISGGLEADVVCSHCKHPQRRLYKKTEHELLHQTFLVLQDDTGLLCDSSTSPNKTHLVEEEKQVVSESIANITIPPSNTHLMTEQTDLLELL